MKECWSIKYWSFFRNLMHIIHIYGWPVVLAKRHILVKLIKQLIVNIVYLKHRPCSFKWTTLSIRSPNRIFPVYIFFVMWQFGFITIISLLCFPRFVHAFPLSSSTIEPRFLRPIKYFLDLLLRELRAARLLFPYLLHRNSILNWSTKLRKYTLTEPVYIFSNDEAKIAMDTR